MTHRADPQTDRRDDQTGLLLRLDLQGATALDVITGSGTIAVTADSEPGVVVIEGLRPSRRHGGYGRALRREGKRWIIHPRRAGALRVRCPAGFNVTLSTRSGDISAQGPLGEVRTSASSGQIDIAEVQSLNARTRSGHITVRDCAGDARLCVVSGGITVERAGAVGLLTVSGHVQLGDIGGKVDAVAVSGTVRVQAHGDGDLSIATISGDIRVGLPGHLRPHVLAQQMSGKLRNDLPAGADLRLRLRSVSGNIAIGSA